MKNLNIPPKQQTAFPEIGILRKGGPKEKGRSKDGREIDVMGKDLNDRFRSVFHPGTADIQGRFFAVYQTYQPAVVKAMMPFQSVWCNWTCFYEAHQGGTMIAKADPLHVISLRHPGTKEYLVRDGKPFTAFTPGQKFEFNGQEIKFKPVGRLRLFLPDLRRFVTFQLKTTSFYDRLNVEQNLAAIQAIADAINGGNAAGIPFLVYRRETEITWKQNRIKKWLIYLEIDPEAEWTQKAMDALAHKGIPQDGMAAHSITVKDDEIERWAAVGDEEDGDEEFEDEAGWVRPEDQPEGQYCLPIPPSTSSAPAVSLNDPAPLSNPNPAEGTASATVPLPPIPTPPAPPKPTEPAVCEKCGEKFPLHKADCPTKKRATLHYQDRTAVAMENKAEVSAYDAWVEAHPGQKPASRDALRESTTPRMNAGACSSHTSSELTQLSHQSQD